MDPQLENQFGMSLELYMPPITMSLLPLIILDMFLTSLRTVLRLTIHILTFSILNKL